jgi:hypothetical protein
MPAFPVPSANPEEECNERAHHEQHSAFVVPDEAEVVLRKV